MPVLEANHRVVGPGDSSTYAVLRL